MAQVAPSSTAVVHSIWHLLTRVLRYTTSKLYLAPGRRQAAVGHRRKGHGNDIPTDVSSAQTSPPGPVAAGRHRRSRDMSST